MIFTNADVSLTDGEVTKVENEIGLLFPPVLRQFYLTSNGGEPDPYVIRAGKIQTVVSEALPLVSAQGRRTAVDSYRHLVLSKKLVPQNFFPLAVDAGGDFFFVDCSDGNAPVFHYCADNFFGDGRFEKISDSLEAFWLSLEPESA